MVTTEFRLLYLSLSTRNPFRSPTTIDGGRFQFMLQNVLARVNTYLIRERLFASSPAGEMTPHDVSWLYDFSLLVGEEGNEMNET